MPQAAIPPIVDVFTSTIGNTYGIKVTEGFGCILQIGITNDGLYSLVGVVQNGSNYRVGDTLTIPGDELGGVVGPPEIGGNDLTYTLVSGDFDGALPPVLWGTTIPMPALPTLTVANGISSIEIPVSGGSGFGAKMIARKSNGSGCTIDIKSGVNINYYNNDNVIIKTGGTNYQVNDCLFINYKNTGGADDNYDLHCVVTEVDYLGAVTELGKFSGLYNSGIPHDLPDLTTIRNSYPYNFSVTGSGNDILQLNVSASGGYNAVVANSNAIYGYTINTPLVIFGDMLGGSQPTNNLYCKVASVGTNPNSTVLTVGNFSGTPFGSIQYQNIHASVMRVIGGSVSVSNNNVTVLKNGAGYIPGMRLGLGAGSGYITVDTVNSYGCILTITGHNISVGNGTYNLQDNQTHITYPVNLYGRPDELNVVFSLRSVNFSPIGTVVNFTNFSNTSSVNGDDGIIMQYPMGYPPSNDYFVSGNCKTLIAPGFYPAYPIGLNKRGTSTNWLPISNTDYVSPVLMYISNDNYSIYKTGTHYLSTDEISLNSNIVGSIQKFNIMNVSHGSDTRGSSRENFPGGQVYRIKTFCRQLGTFNGTFNPLLITSTISNDYGLNCTLLVSLPYYNTTIISGGHGYTVNSILTIPGTKLGGTSPAHDLTVKITGVNPYGTVTAISRSHGVPSNAAMLTYAPLTNITAQGQIISANAGINNSVGTTLTISQNSAITGETLPAALITNILTVSEGVVSALALVNGSSVGNKIYKNIVARIITFPRLVTNGAGQYTGSEQPAPVQMTNCILAITNNGVVDISYTYRNGTTYYDNVTKAWVPIPFDAFYYIKPAIIVGGTGYAVGDILTVKGSKICGGVDGINDFTATVKTISIYGEVTELNDLAPPAYGVGVFIGITNPVSGLFSTTVPCETYATNSQGGPSGGQRGIGLKIDFEVPTNTTTDNYVATIFAAGVNYTIGDVLTYYPNFEIDVSSLDPQTAYDAQFIAGITKIMMTVSGVDHNGGVTSLNNIQGKGIHPASTYKITGVNYTSHVSPVYIGTDLVIDVTCTGGLYNVAIVNGGSGYMRGFKILMSGVTFGGKDLINDLDFTIDTVTRGAVISLSNPTTADSYPSNTNPFVTTNLYNKSASGLVIDLAGTYPNPYVIIPQVRETGYLVGDLITIAGSNWGGVSPDNDLTCTVLTTDFNINSQNSLPITRLTNIRGVPYTTYDTMKFILPVSLKNVVYMEFTKTAGLDAPCLIQISEIIQNGVTINGVPYWRMLQPNVNNDAPDHLSITKNYPNNYDTFNVRLVDMSGQPLWQERPWTIELVIYSQV